MKKRKCCKYRPWTCSIKLFTVLTDFITCKNSRLVTLCFYLIVIRLGLTVTSPLTDDALVFMTVKLFYSCTKLKPERFANGKYTSLLGPSASYEENEVLLIQTLELYHKTLSVLTDFITCIIVG